MKKILLLWFLLINISVFSQQISISEIIKNQNYVLFDNLEIFLYDKNYDIDYEDVEKNEYGFINKANNNYLIYTLNKPNQITFLIDNKKNYLQLKKQGIKDGMVYERKITFKKPKQVDKNAVSAYFTSYILKKTPIHFWVIKHENGNVKYLISFNTL